MIVQISIEKNVDGTIIIPDVILKYNVSWHRIFVLEIETVSLLRMKM